MKYQRFWSGILSTTAIATSVVFASVAPAQPCMMSKYDRTEYNLPTWLRSPLSGVIALPGIALATGLFIGGRSFET